MVLVTLPPELGDSFGGIDLKQQAKSNTEARGSELKPINLKLQEPNRYTKPPLKPRRYQVELCKHALAKNTIIYLGTGLGKTFIVVMLLKYPEIDEQIRQGRRAVFLAPTQDLVKQQAEYIYRQVSYKVKVYCGRTCNTGLHIDNWDKSVWDAELQKYELLFMTPAILNQALAINALDWKNISVVIFDEVHHAATTKKERTGKKAGSAYSQILKHYNNMYFRSNLGHQTKFIGLTASLINNMPKGPEDITLGLIDLENKLHAVCVTDLSAIESKPKHKIWTYDPLDLHERNDTLIELFYEYAKRYEEALDIAQAKKMSVLGPQNDNDKRVLSYHNRLRMASSGFSIKPGSFHKVLRQIAAIRKNSGVWTMANICFNLVQAMEIHGNASFISATVKPIYAEFSNILKKVLLAVYNLVGSNRSTLLFEFTSAKLMCLLEILKKEHERMVDKTGPKETFSCIVFVKSRVEVVAICSWLIKVSEHIAGYDFIKANYAIGLSATAASKWACITRRKSTQQSLMLDDFRRGKLNVIVTTSVLEEGIDLPVCSTIIRYDTADTFRVYVQSRGRARQQESSYVILSEITKEKEARDALNKYNEFEERIKEVLKSGDQSKLSDKASAPKTNHGGDFVDNKQDVFIDKENQIYITSSNAKTILHMYCSRLSRRCPYSDGLQYKRQMLDDLYQTTLYFPPGCPIKDSIIGRERKTFELADSSAVIAAFEALYRAGELDKNGVPVRYTEEHIDQLLTRHGMQPNFNPLHPSLEGQIIANGERSFHVYTWKLCQLNSSSVFHGFNTKRFKLFRINFTAESEDVVRRDTYHHFSHPGYGLIVDTSFDQSILPTRIFSHYGTFQVRCELIDENLRIDNHKDNSNYFSYTFRLLKTFWNFPDARKESFVDRCLFYLVPLNEHNNVDWGRLVNAFYIDRTDIRPGDVVRLNKFYSTEENFTKRFVVHEIRSDLDAHSTIPGCRETFLGRAKYQGFNVTDLRQPVVALWPISREFGRTSPGKKVRSEDSSQLTFYLSQFLERIKCDPHEAYQAYNLPEIVYRVYLDSLGTEIETQFLNNTAKDRGVDIVPEVAIEKDEQNRKQVNDASIDDDSDKIDFGDDNYDDNRPVAERAEKPQDCSDGDIDFEFSASDEDYSDDSDRESGEVDDSSDSDDGTAPTNKYLEILSRQEYNLMQRGDTLPEKWDLSEYVVPDLKQQPVERESFHHYSSNVDSSPRASSILRLREDTIGHQLIIEEVLRNFKKGILGDSDYLGEDQDYDRPCCKVDLSISPPVKFDKRTKPSDAPLKPAFLEALTLRRAGDGNDLEALENIGDSYMKYCISVVLFRYLEQNEGLLTSARSRLVGNKHFYHLAKANKLGSYAITNKFDREVLNAALGAAPSCKNRLRQKDMADMIESLVGACLINRGEYEAIMAMKWLGLGHVFREDNFYEFHKYAVVFAKPEIDSTDKENYNLIDYLKQCKGQLKKFQAIINYDFNNPAYLAQAFTHASAFTRYTESYERLEFLGDAILDFLITMTLYNAGYTRSPGQLTSSRSALVNNCTFARLAVKYNYDVFIQHANQQLYDELHRVNEGAKSDDKLGFLDRVEFDRVTKTLADVFEAVAGAIYLDSGCSLDTVYGIYYPIMKNLIDAEIEHPTKNILTQLYEMFPGFDRIKFEYFKSTTGEGEESVDCAKCTIFGLDEEYFGEGLNKRHAKKRAAEQVMENLPPSDVITKLNEQWQAKAEASKKRPELRGGNRRGRGGGRGRGGQRRGGQRGRPRPRFLSNI